MIRVSLLVAMTMWGTSVIAQSQRVCASHEYNLELQMSNPEIQSRRQFIENQTQEFIKHSAVSRSNEDLITIPVVVHVLWNTEKQNISDAQIQSQLDVLNEDFRKLNDNFSSTVEEFESIAADFEIEFCLSSVDPSGKSTTGITRTYTTRTSWGTKDDVKYTEKGGVDAWPTDHYLNMWVANIGGGILGFAQFPGGLYETDGIVMSPQYFGSREKQPEDENFYLSAPFDLGRTATHEVGHWLNLRHVWGDGGCGIDDLVEDTPLSDGANHGCPSNHRSCNTLDNVQNFMDYTDDVCMTMFTKGQKNRSRALFSEGGFRYAMRSSSGCGTVDTRCASPTNVTVHNIADYSARISVEKGINVQVNTLQINEGNQGWKTVSKIDENTFDFEYLSSCTFYEARIISKCAFGSYDTSKVVSFSTTGQECKPNVCYSPTVIDVADQESSALTGNILISWEAVANAKDYQYELRVASLPFLKIVKTVGAEISSISYKGLPKWWKYEIRIRSKCINEEGYSDWTSFKEFTPGNNRLASNKGDITIQFEYDMSAIFKVYPNPARDQINLRFGAELNDIDVKLIDMTGKVSVALSTNMSENGVLSIDLSNTPPGLYFLNVRSEELELMTQKVIVTR